jgi:hypothetical protein
LWVRWTAGAAIGASLAAGIGLYYETEVCNERVTSSGGVVDVCRQLHATDPPMIAIGLVTLVALTTFFSEITGFGVSLKREVRATRRQANAALSKAAAAQTTSSVAEEVALQSATTRQPPHGATESGVLPRIESLVSDYNQIRAAQDSGRARSTALTKVVSRMLTELTGVEPAPFPFQEFVDDPEDDGRRIAAYAYAYANPDSKMAPGLVGAILSEKTRFGQYWAIRALSRVVRGEPRSLDFNSRRDLERLLRTFGPNTDRAYELRELLGSLPGK